MTPYTVGLVINRAGLNVNQLDAMRAKIKLIARTEIGKLGIHMIVPAVNHEGPASLAEITRLTSPLRNLSSVQIEIAEHVLALSDCMRAFLACDEVWCCPCEGVVARSRAWSIYKRRHEDPRPAKFKLIPPWALPEVPETKSKPKALKG